MARPCSALLPCALLGVAGGMRTFMPVAAVGWYRRGRVPSTLVLSAMAAGELVYDKLPRTPSRLEPSGRAARVLTSGIAGATLAAAPGALAAIAATLAATPAAHHLRRTLSATGRVPTWVPAAVEDGLAVGLAAAGLRIV